MSNFKKDQQREKRRRRIRSKVIGTAQKPRLSVFRSNDHIYAQIIDDQKGTTLVSACDKELLVKTKDKMSTESQTGVSTKKSAAFTVGGLLAEKSLKKKIKRIVFDRGGYKYHGRISSLAEGARKGGLEF